MQKCQFNLFRHKSSPATTLRVYLRSAGLKGGKYNLLTNTCGLVFVSFSFYLSVFRYSGLAFESCFFLGLLLMFVPNLLRLLSPASSRLERICLLCVLGICFYLVQFIGSPQHFTSFDEFLHWRTADDVLRTGHLFSVNSMLPVSP